LLRKLENAKISLNSQILSRRDTQKKPVSFLRSLWNALVDDDIVYDQQTQESDPTKCINMIEDTQKYLRDIFQLRVGAEPYSDQRKTVMWCYITGSCQKECLGELTSIVYL